MSENGFVIETRELTKRYGEEILAVDRLELRVRRGDVYGFLGPNGAGKTTTLRMLLGLVRRTRGGAVVLGAAPGAPDGLARIGGVFALMLGVLTLFTQRPGRMAVLAAKLLALAGILLLFAFAVLVAGSVTSYVIAVSEDADADWPSAWLLVRTLAAGWFILAVWAFLGVMLAVLSRGTALAIGIAILYALVIEGLISALVGSVDAIEVVFVLVSGVVLRRRDVT